MGIYLRNKNCERSVFAFFMIQVNLKEITNLGDKQR